MSLVESSSYSHHETVCGTQRSTWFPSFNFGAMGADYYKLLGVDKNASDEDIKKAYKKMVSTLHTNA